MRLLIGCLLWCLASPAQITQPLEDSSIVKTIDLPATEPFDTSHSWHRVNSPYVYIISDKDLYDHFGYGTTMKFYGFNFIDFHILGQKKNDKEWIWVMRENKKAFNEIPLATMPAYRDSSHKKRNPFFSDTLIRSVASTGKADWYTTGHGDCFASFNYKLYTDKYHPVLLLKEWNHWGGCRAGGSRSYALSFSMPAGIVYTTKNTILVEKYNDID